MRARWHLIEAEADTKEIQCQHREDDCANNMESTSTNGLGISWSRTNPNLPHSEREPSPSEPYQPTGHIRTDFHAAIVTRLPTRHIVGVLPANRKFRCSGRRIVKVPVSRPSRVSLKCCARFMYDNNRWEVRISYIDTGKNILAAATLYGSLVGSPGCMCGTVRRTKRPVALRADPDYSCNCCGCCSWSGNPACSRGTRQAT